MKRKSITACWLVCCSRPDSDRTSSWQRGHQATKDPVNQRESSDDDDLECPARGLPACEGHMKDDKE